MNKLLLRFFKRFIIVPVLVAMVAVIAISFTMPKIINESHNASVVSIPDIDMSMYKLNEYNRFGELNAGDYVATITCEDVNLSCAVCYDSTNEINAVGLQKLSHEPWNNGNVAIVGDNITNKFKYLHNVQIGTELSINYYKNAVCTYKITNVTYNHSINEIEEQLKSNNLVLCVPYTDFESPDASKLYTFYFAELGGVEEWK